MTRRVTIALAVAAFTVAGARSSAAQAPADTEGEAETEARTLPRSHLAGPRFGFTVFTGDVAALRARAGREAIMTQFGWQFETQIASRTGGHRALMEWVVLVGGVEQSELNLSLSWLAGYRMPGGFELGVGPSVSTNKDNWRLNTSMVVAGGATAPFGDLHVPVHLAVAIAEGGPRITALVGWIIG